MTSTAISAQQSKISIGDTPVQIENVVSFSGFDGESSQLDVTDLSSVAKEYLVGLPDYGSFSFEYHPDFRSTAVGQEALRVAGISGAQTAFILELADGTTIEFTAVVKNSTSTSGGVDAALTGSVSLQISGAIDITGSA